MTTPTPEEIRTMLIHKLSEWIGDELGVAVPTLLTLDFSAFLETKAREGRLKGWNQYIRRHSVDNGEWQSGWYRVFKGNYLAIHYQAPTELESRLRALALALVEAGKGEG